MYKYKIWTYKYKFSDLFLLMCLLDESIKYNSFFEISHYKVLFKNLCLKVYYIKSKNYAS